MALTQEDLQAIATLLDNKLNTSLTPINNRLDSMENRLDKLESEVSALKDRQIEFRKEIRRTQDMISATHKLALDTWGQLS